MPRASDGSYALPPGTLVNTGDTVLPSQHNPAMNDIAQALTGSLPRSGAASMLGNLPMNNNRIVNLADGVNDTDAATLGQLAGFGTPIGAVVDYWGTQLPSNFMLCAGQEISRSEYSELFDVIGTNAGAGNGTTTFNLPDYRGRVGAGLDNMGGVSASRLDSIPSSTLGGSGGSQAVTLTSGQMPSHSHSGTTSTNGNHSHTMQLYQATDTQSTARASVSASSLLYSNAGGSINAAGNHNHTFTTSTAGSGQAHSNVQPTIVCNKIIRVR